MVSELIILHISEQVKVVIQWYLNYCTMFFLYTPLRGIVEEDTKITNFEYIFRPTRTFFCTRKGYVILAFKI
jgi:hypothetical protein